MTRRIMLSGKAFAGKTTQGWTMPKPLGAFAFDPKTKPALAGCPEVEVWEFFPAAYDTHVRTLEGVEPKGNPAADALEKFNKFLQSGIEKGEFARFKTLMLDYTHMELLIAESIMTARGRDMMTPNKGNVKMSSKGGEDKRDDYRPTKDTAFAIVAQMAYLGPNFIMCSHIQEKDQVKVIDGREEVVGTSTQLRALGTLRTDLPSFFDVSLLCFAKGDSSRVKYWAKTHATDSYPGIGVVGARDLPMDFDMTIEDWGKPEEYGLGKLLKMTGGTE